MQNHQSVNKIRTKAEDLELRAEEMGTKAEDLEPRAEEMGSQSEVPGVCRLGKPLREPASRWPRAGVGMTHGRQNAESASEKVPDVLKGIRMLRLEEDKPCCNVGASSNAGWQRLSMAVDS